MNRSKALLQCIEPRTQIGVEIGPLNRPVVKKSEGQIYYIDYATLDQLKEIHKVDPNIPLDQICGPDFIWGRQTLLELLGSTAPVDYLIASHVLEHVPDMVGWLREVSSILKLGGILSLALPDKRFTFDYLRPLTSLGDILEAHWDGSRRPSLRHVWDAVSMSVKLDHERAWISRPKSNQLKHFHTQERAREAVKQVIGDPNYYYDCHCWVFTPNHILSLWRELAELGLFDFELVNIIPTAPTEMEFFVTLRKLPDGPEKLFLQRKSFDKWKLSDDYRLVWSPALVKSLLKHLLPSWMKDLLKSMMKWRFK